MRERGMVWATACTERHGLRERGGVYSSGRGDRGTQTVASLQAKLKTMTKSRHSWGQKAQRSAVKLAASRARVKELEKEESRE